MSQIRSRQHIAAIAAGQRADPLALLKDQLPPDLDSQRAAASSYLFIRKSMARLVHTGRDDIRKTIRAGGHVQVLLLDPGNPELLKAANRTGDPAGERLLEGRIRSTLSELASLPRGERGRLDIRFCSFVPRISVNAFNLDHPRRRRCHVHPALRIPASR